MGIFNKNQNAAPKTPEQTFAVARSNLLVVIGFTLINVVLQLIGSDTYFLFSATTPMLLAMEGGAVGAVLALLCIGLYVLCWAMSKKRPGWIVAALVFFILDSLLLLLGGVELIFDLLIHVWVLYYLITGTVAMVKMKRNPTPAMPEVAIDPTVVPAYVNEGVPAPVAPEAPAAPVAPVEQTAPVMVNGEPIDQQ